MSRAERILAALAIALVAALMVVEWQTGFIKAAMTTLSGPTDD